MNQTNESRPAAPTPSAAASPPATAACRTNLFCPVCGKEFLPEEIGKKPHCRRCGYLESCCNPDG